jgi:hypothetical protein
MEPECQRIWQHDVISKTLEEVIWFFPGQPDIGHCCAYEGCGIDERPGEN